MKPKQLCLLLCAPGTLQWVFVLVDGRRTGVRHRWAPIAANLAVGVSLGLPLYLFMRERRLEASGA